MIPWGPDGLLPINYINNLGEEVYSPFSMTLPQFFEGFGGSPERVTLIKSLLVYRERLRAAGISSWVHWVNGSFVENALVTRQREPDDMDLVTIYEIPNSFPPDEFKAAHPEIFDELTIEKNMRLDSYSVPYNGDSIRDVLIALDFWRDFWSRTKEGQPKGFILLGCDQAEDLECESLLKHNADMEDEQ